MAAWRLARGLIRLRSEVNTEYPGRAKVSDGSIGDASHSSRTSDHNPDPRGVVYAIDVTQDDPFDTPTPNDDVAEALAEWLRASKDKRIKYVIWRGRMFSSYSTRTRKAWEWGDYNGPNGHFHHVHISLNAGSGDEDRGWGFKRPVGAPVTRKWIPFGKNRTDASLRALGGELVEVTEVEMILTALADDWNALDLLPAKIDGAWTSEKDFKAIGNFKRRMIELQKFTGQMPWPNTDAGVGTNTIAALRFWNAQRKK